MIKRFLPLVLMCAWAPTVLAFPPCPRAPIQQVPLSQTVSAFGDTPAWFQISDYTQGAPYIVLDLNAGKCRDRIAVPASNASNGIIGLNPGISPINGYGTVTLPEFPTVAVAGLRVPYRLDFTVDNAPLLNAGDWMDVAELDFSQDRGLTASGWPLSSVYRVRKMQRGSATIVRVIESRASDETTHGHVPVERVVAEIPLTGEGGTTPIALRWTQYAESSTTEPATIMYSVNSRMEVLGRIREPAGPANHVMYTAQLPRQWADALKMGLLDYNAPIGGQVYGSNFRTDINNVWLSAEMPQFVGEAR